MSVKIKYLNKKSGSSSSNIVLFVDEKFNIVSLKKYISGTEFSYIKDLLKTSDLKKKYICLRSKFKKKDHFNINQK